MPKHTRIAIAWIVFTLGATHSGLTATLDPAAVKAKHEAEAKGYLFLTSHDEIVARAKKEGKLRATSSLGDDARKAMWKAFREEYPFIDVHVEDLGGEAAERWLLELKAGLAQGWDANHIPDHLYLNNEVSLYQKKFDILGMAKAGILAIPLPMIDPANRNVVVITSNVQVVAYNKKLLSPDKVPDEWEGFLKPELKGKKFVAEIEPAEVAGLVPAWGLEKTLDFGRKLAAQQPLWGSGTSRLLVSMIAGEHTLFIGPNFHTVRRAQDRDPSGSLDYKILEPVPVRLTQPVGVLEKADHPYAGLLWVEFQAGPKGQQILDKYRPYGGSVFVPGSVTAEVTRGRKLSVVNWDHFAKMRDYKSRIVEAYGFPTAEKK